MVLEAILMILGLSFVVNAFFGFTEAFYVVVQQGHWVILERFGKQCEILEAGFHFKWPWHNRKHFAWSKTEETRNWSNTKETQTKVVRGYQVPMMEQVFDVPEYTVDSQDNIKMKLNIILFYKIVDPVKALYNTTDLCKSIQLVLDGSIRKAASNHKHNVVAQSISEMTEVIKNDSSKSFANFGIELNSIRFESIALPQEILAAFTKREKDKLDAETTKIGLKLGLEVGKAQRQMEENKVEVETRRIKELVNSGVPGDKVSEYILAASLRESPELQAAYAAHLIHLNNNVTRQVALQQQQQMMMGLQSFVPLNTNNINAAPTK